MTHGSTLWTTLEQWSPLTFLVAAGLFTLPVLAFGFEAVAGIAIDVSPAVVFLFVLVIFVGLLGLYPRLAAHDATLAKGGAALLAATAAIIVLALAASVLSVGPTFGKSTIAAIVMAVLAGSGLTVTTFGTASLRSRAHPRPVGGFLLVTGAGMAVVMVGMLVFGDPAPAWVGAVANGLIAISLGATGYTLRGEDIPTSLTEATDDVTAS
ncbi:hypothetical protein BRD00_00305 [Halobacteriales archaeon QS_8_69_26]|nr:MAG: hypothetical protein BRD00_00305 [Halobacteriales archaeon QS_8_69_26]